MTSDASGSDVCPLTLDATDPLFVSVVPVEVRGIREMLSCVRLGRRWTSTAAVAIAVADAALAASRSPRSRRARVLTKPALLPAIAIATRGRGSRPSGPVGVALAASWLGDVALLSRSDPAVLGGIAGFAVAHLSYVAEIRRRLPGPTPRPEGIAVTAVFGAVLTGAGTVLWRGLDTQRSLRVPVLGYAGSNPNSGV